MASLSQTYVDPSIAGNSGTGTIGDPYGDVQYALNTMTRDATNGDQINIKASTAEILTAALDLTSYGTPTFRIPLVFRGYTTAANDGGKGDIDGNASFSIINNVAINEVYFIDMKLHNTAANIIVSLNDNCGVYSCELYDSTAIAIDLDNNPMVVNCYLHDVSGSHGIFVAGDAFIYGNHVEGGFTTSGVSLTGGACSNNIVKLTSTNSADGFNYSDKSQVFNNTAFATAGTGDGFVGSGSGRDNIISFNNVAEGFSGTGGAGYGFSSSDHYQLFGSNAAYNCTTNDERSTGTVYVELGGNLLPLSASPFTDPSSGDFSIGTEMKASGIENFNGSPTSQFMDIGAAQREEPTGGGATQTSHGNFS